MRKVSVEVLEDGSHPEGGYAVVLLHGIECLPDGATFRIKPVDARGTSEGSAGGTWPRGEQRPVAVRRTEAGTALLIGPDIVECPALLPGTLGVIEIQSAGVRGEFLWPSIRPTARPRRRNLSIVKPPVARTATAKSKPAAEPEVPAVVAGAQQSVASGDAMAGLPRSRRVREAATAVAGPQGEAQLPAKVPVTALDHAIPPTATIAEAIGANVVQLNVVRDCGSTAGVASKTAEARDAPARATTRNSAGRAGSGLRPSRALRASALAASFAVVVSGGFVLLSQWPGFLDRASQAKRDAASVVQRAEAMPHAEPQSQPVVDPPQPQAALAPESASVLPNLPAEAVPQVATPPPQPAPPAPGQDVTLRMRGGGFQITGELKGFDGAKYVIETRSAGVLTMDASRFECLGEACVRPAAVILPLSERPSPVKPDVYRIEGAPALAAEFMPHLIRDYAQSIGASVSELLREAGQGVRYRIADPRGVELATIEVSATATAAGLTALEHGTAAIALADRPLTPETEPRRAPVPRGRASQPSPTPALPSEIVVGLDGIALVASPATAPASISLDALARVLSGQTSDWYELGGAPGPIQLYLPLDGTGTLDTIVRQVLRPRGLELSRTAQRTGSEAEAAAAASRDPRGIALVSFAAQRGAKPINLETACGLITRPTAFAVKAGEYPLVRRLSLQLPPQLAQPSARGLARIAQSGEVHGAIAAGRILDQSIAFLPIEEQAERMAWAANAPPQVFDAAELRQMLADLEGATRLSVTFRYVPGTNDLDQRSRREIARLAAAMKVPELAGRRVILAGFTEVGRRFQVNKQIALKRAGQIRSALLAAAGPGFDQRLVQAKGYGPLAPVGCNGTPEGARLNRRVEVWIRGRAEARAL